MIDVSDFGSFEACPACRSTYVPHNGIDCVFCRIDPKARFDEREQAEFERWQARQAREAPVFAAPQEVTAASNVRKLEELRARHGGER